MISCFAYSVEGFSASSVYSCCFLLNNFTLRIGRLLILCYKLYCESNVVVAVDEGKCVRL